MFDDFIRINEIPIYSLFVNIGLLWWQLSFVLLEQTTQTNKYNITYNTHTHKHKDLGQRVEERGA